MSAPKLSKNSAAMKLLRQKFENGELTGREGPKSVWESEPIFKKHKLDTFRAQLSKLKRELLLKSGDEVEESILVPRCSRDERDKPTKRQKVYDSENEDEDETEEDLLLVEQLKENSSQGFTPLHIMSNWKEHDTMTKRVTVSIALPSGIDAGSFSLRVVEGGCFLELIVKWPRPLLDLEMMHKKWLQDDQANYKVYHPEYVGFQDSLKKFRARSSDWIESSTKIRLPFVVETHIHDKHNLAWRDDSTRLLYVRLKAVVEQYTVQNDNEAFEML